MIDGYINLRYVKINQTKDKPDNNAPLIGQKMIRYKKAGPRGFVQETRTTDLIEPPTFCFLHTNYVGGSRDIHASPRAYF